MKLEDIAPRMVCFWRICSEFAQCRFIDLSPGIDWDNLRAAIPSFLTITAWRFSVTPQGWIWSWHFSTELAWMIIQVARFFFPCAFIFAVSQPGPQPIQPAVSLVSLCGVVPWGRTLYLLDSQWHHCRTTRNEWRRRPVCLQTTLKNNGWWITW